MNKENSEVKIPFFRALIGDEEIASVVQTLKSGWLTTGPKVKQFEKEFAAMVGAKHAVAVNSATAALHLALEALGVGPGDEVLVPTFTFAATAEVVIHVGARPVFVDCDPTTLNMCVKDMKQKRTDKTRAIMPVHFAGQPCEMDTINAFASEFGIPVVEDAAHAFPASYKNQPIGSIGAVTCFSFYANKTITTGEGGMATTDDEELAIRMRQMSLHGLSRNAWNRFSDKGSWYYEIEAAGFKYNMADIAAAIGIGQLNRAEEFLVGRRRGAEQYRKAFADSPWVSMLDVGEELEHSWHLAIIKLNLDKISISRNEFIPKLNELGVGTSVHYTPLHLHPFYQREYGYKPSDYPEATAVYDQIISLPLFADITVEEVDYVVKAVERIAQEHSV